MANVDFYLIYDCLLFETNTDTDTDRSVCSLVAHSIGRYHSDAINVNYFTNPLMLTINFNYIAIFPVAAYLIGVKLITKTGMKLP